MNKLYMIENMGFTVSWKTINVGLNGYDVLPEQITFTDVFHFLREKFYDDADWREDIFSLIYEEDHNEKVRSLIQKFADNDPAKLEMQFKKWRALNLQTELEEINPDCLQGLLQLMEFWSLMGMPKDCPMDFPQSSGSLSVQNYFTESMLEQQIKKNKEWLVHEIEFIVAAENA